MDCIRDLRKLTGPRKLILNRAVVLVLRVDKNKFNEND